MYPCARYFWNANSTQRQISLILVFPDFNQSFGKLIVRYLKQYALCDTKLQRKRSLNFVAKFDIFQN